MAFWMPAVAAVRRNWSRAGGRVRAPARRIFPNGSVCDHGERVVRGGVLGLYRTNGFDVILARRPTLTHPDMLL